MFKNRATPTKGVPNYLNSTQMEVYIKELKSLRGTVIGQGKPSKDYSGVYEPRKSHNIEAARKRIAEIEKIIERCTPPSISPSDKNILARRMREIENIIREHRPLTQNQLHNPTDVEGTKENGLKLYNKLQITQPLERELKNIRKILLPDDPMAGDLSYLNRPR